MPSATTGATRALLLRPGPAKRACGRRSRQACWQGPVEGGRYAWFARPLHSKVQNQHPGPGFSFPAVSVRIDHRAAPNGHTDHKNGYTRTLLRQVALGVHLRLLPLGRRGKRDHTEDARAHPLCDGFDRAALAGPVTPFPYRPDQAARGSPILASSVHFAILAGMALGLFGLAWRRLRIA
jgi:hypothetical protein